MRHLTPAQAETNLRLGKTLEQWLGIRKESDCRVLRWLSVTRDPLRGYVVTVFEGIEDTRTAKDVYWADAVESDQDGAVQPVDAAGKEFVLEDENGVLDFVQAELGGARDRFVNKGLLQDDYLAERNPSSTSS
jgi:hypothetical protein